MSSLNSHARWSLLTGAAVVAIAGLLVGCSAATPAPSTVPASPGSSPGTPESSPQESPAPTEPAAAASLWDGLSSPVLSRCDEYDSAVFETALGAAIEPSLARASAAEQVGLTCEWYSASETRFGRDSISVRQVVGETSTLKETAEWSGGTVVKLKGLGAGAFLEIQKSTGENAVQSATVYFDVDGGRVLVRRMFELDAKKDAIAEVLQPVAEHVASRTATMPKLTDKILKSDPLNPRQLLGIRMDDVKAAMDSKKVNQAYASFGPTSAGIGWDNSDWKKPRAMAVNGSTSVGERTPWEEDQEVTGLGDRAWVSVQDEEPWEDVVALTYYSLTVVDGADAWDFTLEVPAKDTKALDRLKEFAAAWLVSRHS